MKAGSGGVGMWMDEVVEEDDGEETIDDLLISEKIPVFSGFL